MTEKDRELNALLDLHLLGRVWDEKKCNVCRKWTDRPHVIGVEKFCAEHCPECRRRRTAARVCPGKSGY